ncbi:hypothetical protein ElyMa_006378900 [Elysia marginata]|uniref:Reverse transcriptase domain-containing protein n=1 Tax=Elysia marginata TaxID=1093978 RepID=A0AAV4HQA1_9GAST|nr:hypothetical protein ElyMa_006378900 [Elysia marginata]
MSYSAARGRGATEELASLDLFIIIVDLSNSNVDRVQEVMHALLVISNKTSAGRHNAIFLFIIVLDYARRRALADGKEEKLGFAITPKRSRRYLKIILADLDLAYYDITLLSDAREQAQELILRVERECSRVGLGLNHPKTKYLTYYNRPSPTVHETWHCVRADR